MKAALCTHYGPPEELEIRDLPSPQPGPGQLLVEVRACGVNFPDALLIQGSYNFAPELPFAPGAEVAGIVRGVGSGITRFHVGDRIIAFAGTNGGFAEELVADEASCIALPDAMDFAVGASFVGAYGTSYYALKDRGHLRPGQNLVVLGAAGGVGLAAVELGHMLGARVIAATSTQEKLDLALAHGASDGFVYPVGPLSKGHQKAVSENIRRLTGGQGADLLYDPVGGDYAEPALRAMNWEGRYLVVGFTAGDIPRIPLNLPLLKGCEIVGVFWGVTLARHPEAWRANISELANWIAAGRLKPHISHRFPLARAGEAVRLLMDREAQGKIVLIP